MQWHSLAYQVGQVHPLQKNRQINNKCKRYFKEKYCKMKVKLSNFSSYNYIRTQQTRRVTADWALVQGGFIAIKISVNSNVLFLKNKNIGIHFMFIIWILYIFTSFHAISTLIFNNITTESRGNLLPLQRSHQTFKASWIQSDCRTTASFLIYNLKFGKTSKIP